MAASVPITDPALGQVLRELSDLRTESAKSHTEIRDSIDSLSRRMDIANGRTGKLEEGLAEVRIRQAREDGAEDERRSWHAFLRDKATAFAIGAALGVIAAIVAILY